ncbi:hypothetical protein AB210_3147 [Acinetobacter baumannii AB210]|nr:hypothetical protein A1S_3911 [Acinetobacter baumannii ATCC 17978]EGK46298.1 hypothetical protein AB210_3147 [Acinetobacter baumannii AB210]
MKYGLKNTVKILQSHKHLREQMRKMPFAPNLLLLF